VIGAGVILLVDVLAGHVVHRRIIGLKQHQRAGGRRDLDPVKLHQQATGLLGDGDDRAGT
jgi:hypothetical protein